MPCEPSVLPLSAISTSPAISLRRRKSLAFATHRATVSASLRHGMRIVSSQDSSMIAWRIRPLLLAFSADRDDHAEHDDRAPDQRIPRPWLAEQEVRRDGHQDEHQRIDWKGGRQ